MIRMISPSNKRPKVHVVSDSPQNCNEGVIVAITSDTRQNMMSQRRGIHCDDATATTTTTCETKHILMGQRSGIHSDAPTNAITSETRHNQLGYEDNRHDQNYQKPREDESVKTKFRCGRFTSTKMKFPSSFISKVKPQNSEEADKRTLNFSNMTRRRSESYSSRTKYLHVQKQRNLLKKLGTEDALRANTRSKSYSSQTKYLHVRKQRNLSTKLGNADARRANTRKPTHHTEETHINQHGVIPRLQHNKILNVLTPREKVFKVLHLFQMILEELERDKAAYRATNKTYLDALSIIVRDGKQVNGEKMVGVVPGVEVGDEFQYKAELKIIGLHFYLSGGIDYKNIEGLDLATSVVASEGNGYDNIFDYDVVIYCGEGMYLKGKNPKVVEDQKMTKGNLSLANSMKAKSPVRVISGKNRKDQKGKRYVYEGLYVVEKYWKEKGPLGKIVCKFKLRRLLG